MLSGTNPRTERAAALTQVFGKATPPEEMRTRLRLRALASTYFFGKFVLGFADLQPDLHLAMARWLQRSSRRKLGLAPRGHLKTSLWTIADCLRLATANPNLRILILNETERLPAKWLSQMQSTVLDNPIYGWLFPEVIPDPTQVPWNQTQLELRRTAHHAQATIEAFGVGGASTGNHYDIVHEDDLVGRKAREEIPTMEKAIEQHKLAESLLIDPSRDVIRTVGTRWHVYDLVDWMLKNEPDLDYFKLACYRPDGTPLWPERFTERRLAKIRLKYGASMFALQYLNDALAEGETEFRPSWLRHWTMDESDPKAPVLVMERPIGYGGLRRVLLADCEIVSLVDPGISPESQHARTAVVTVAIPPPERIAKPARPWAPTDEPDDTRALDPAYEVVVLDAVARRAAPTQVIEVAHEAWQKWHPSIVGMEVFGAQMHLFYWAAQTFPNMPLRKLPMDTTRRKESRIREVVGSLAEQGRLYISRTQADLQEEYEAFPRGRTVDLLDALAWGPTIWAPPDAPAHEPGFDEDDEDPRASALRDGRSPYTGY